MYSENGGIFTINSRTFHHPKWHFILIIMHILHFFIQSAWQPHSSIAFYYLTYF